MKKLGARVLLALFLCIQVFSFTVITSASDSTAQRESQEEAQKPFVSTIPKPYEIEIAKTGEWLSEYWEPRRLTYGYQGDFSEMQSSEISWPQTFHVDQRTRLILIAFATEGIGSDISEVYLQDAKGNFYGGFKKTTDYYIGLEAVSNVFEDPNILVSVDDSNDKPKHNTHSLTPTSEIILPKGDYTIIYSAINTDSQVNPFYVKGYSETKYQTYLKDVDNERREFEKKQTEMTKDREKQLDEEASVTETFGDEDLQTWYESFINGDEETYTGDNYSQPDAFLAPVFVLDETMSIDQIIMDTYNNGLGARPGIITLYNEAGDALYEFQAQGASLGDVPNSLWVVFPELTLEKGVYYLEMDAPEALGYDETGNPIFSVSASMLKPPVFDFTGSYQLNVAVTKTSTRMGPVSGEAPSFSLNSHPLVILDKGSSIEVIGTYEGMQFSQDCEIIERRENFVTCSFGLNADLSNLPYKAAIGAGVLLTFEVTPNKSVKINVEGTGTYDRKESKTKGADYNTYSIIGEAYRVNENLPMYVMAALAKIYGVGNIPGPNSPIEAVVGLLFPALVGVVISVIQGLLAPKGSELEVDPDGHLSVGEKAMKASNNSLGQGLVSEEEKDAWNKYAEALGASGGDAEDPSSVGDNEYESGSGSGDSGYEGSDYGDSEDSGDSGDYGDAGDSGDYGSSSDSDGSGYPSDEGYGSDSSTQDSNQSGYGDSVTKDGSPQGNSLDQNGQNSENTSGTQEVDEPITAVVPTNTKGSTKLVQYDPKTDSWIDPETGSEYNHAANMKFLGEEAERLKDYHERNDYLNKTKQTAMDDYIKEYGAAHKKELNFEKMEKAKIKQAILEAEQAEAKEGTSALGILNQTKVNIIDEVDEAADTIKQTAKDLSKAVHEEIQSIKKDIESDPDFWKNFKSNTWGDVKEIGNNAVDMAKHPLDTLKEIKDMTGKGYEIGKNIANNVYKGVKEVVTDPAKAWEWVKDASGIKDFINSQDMNKSLLNRIGSVLTGTLKLGTTIATIGEAKAAAEGLGNLIKGGKGVIKNAWDDITAVGVKSGSKSSTTAKGIQKELTFTEKGAYIPSKNPPNMNGMTDKSVKALQNVSDDMGVRIQVRPTNKYAKDQIANGNAIPKPQSIKVKTADVYDELLGGPKDAKGLTVIYEPKMPPQEALSKYTKETQAKIQQQFDKRMADFTKKDSIIKDLQKNGFDLQDGKIIVKDPIDPTKTKYVAGDNDIYDITNFDGSALSEKQKQMVMDKLAKDPNANVLHGAHMDWKPGVNQYSPKTKADITFGHTQEAGKNSGGMVIQEGEGLVTINPLSKPTKSFQNGSTGLSPTEQKAYMDKLLSQLKGGA